jgi:hypothetical protein
VSESVVVFPEGSDAAKQAAMAAALTEVLANALSKGELAIDWAAVPGLIAKLTSAGLEVRGEQVETDFGRATKKMIVVDGFRLAIR